MTGNAYITYWSDGTPLLNFDFTGNGNEVITKVIAYSQKSWGKGEDAAHKIWLYTDNTYGQVSKTNISSEELQGACLDKDFFILDAEYKERPNSSDILHYVVMVFNGKIEINKTLKYCKELCDCCTLPEGLLNSFLQVFALKYAMQSKDVDRAINYWNKWYNGEWGCEDSTNIGGCGCAG